MILATVIDVPEVFVRFKPPVPFQLQYVSGTFRGILEAAPTVDETLFSFFVFAKTGANPQ